MSQWLVSNVPALLLLLGLIIVIAGGAVLIQTIVRRRFVALTRDDHNEATKFTYGFIGFVYAFFIGFVVSSMWGQINAADANVRAEGAAAVQMARDLTVFEAPDGDRIREHLLAYEKAAVAEWNQPGGAPSPEADRALDEVYLAYGQVQPKSDSQKTLLATSFSNLDKISQARTVRLLTAREDTGPPWPLWVVIFVTSAMVVGSVIVYGVERAGQHYAMVIIVAIIIAMNILLIMQLSHPYLGDIATSSDPLQEAVWTLSR